MSSFIAWMKSWMTPSPVGAKHEQPQPRVSTPRDDLMEGGYPTFVYDHPSPRHFPSNYGDSPAYPGYRFSPHSDSTSFRKREKEPSRFNGRSDLKDFLDHFKAVAKWNDWGQREMGLQLAICLCDEAREVLSTLSCDQKHDYDCLVEALTRRFCPDGRESQFSVQLMTRTCQTGEDVTSYGHAIRRLASKAYPGLALDERMLVDLFIKGLPNHEMKRHVYLAKTESLSDAINAAVTYEAFDGSNIRKPKPTVSSINNESAKLSEVIVKLSDKVEGLQRELTSLKERKERPRFPQSRDWSNVVCFKCQGKGHVARDCGNGGPAPSKASDKSKN